MPAASCPFCGMSRDEWPNPEGVKRDGNVYCCEGCASGRGCTCGAVGEEQAFGTAQAKSRQTSGESRTSGGGMTSDTQSPGRGQSADRGRPTGSPEQGAKDRTRSQG